MCYLQNRKKKEKLTNVLKRGADTLNAARLARNDNIPTIIVGNVIHKNCRIRYCRETSNNENKENVNPSLSEYVQGVKNVQEKKLLHCCTGENITIY
jgi:hypothetical protein